MELSFHHTCRGMAKFVGRKKQQAPELFSLDESADLRERLLGEIAGIQTHDRATSWAREALPLKNTLTADDAKLLEDAFEKKMSELLLTEAPVPSSGNSSAASEVPSKDARARNAANREPASAIDKSVLAVGAPRRYRNRDHLRFVTQQPCLLCGRKPADAHHIRFVQPRALGRKASDEFTVPLCRSHHRAVHRGGDEQAWWKQTGIDPIKIARSLWKRTRIYEGRLEPDPPAVAAAEPTSRSDGPAVDGSTPAE